MRNDSKMHILASFLCFIFFELVSSAAIESKECLNTYLDCFSRKNESIYQSFIVDNRFNSDKTLQLVKQFKERIPEFYCRVSGCDEQLKEYIKSSLQDFPLEKPTFDGGHHYNKSGHRSTMILSDEDKMHSVRLYSNLLVIRGSDGLPSEERGFSSENNLTVGDSWTDDEDLNDPLGNNQDVWNWSRTGSLYHTANLENNSLHPVTFSGKPELSLNETLRSKRETESCAIGGVTSSTVKCEKWPEVLVCKQKCSFGHGLSTDEGTKTGMNYKCRFSENTWHPQKFQDCKPFINCRASLKEDEEGYLKCTQKDYRSAPSCYIKCGENDAGKNYECSEQFSDDLPDCAELIQMELLYPPE